MFPGKRGIAQIGRKKQNSQVSLNRRLVHFPGKKSDDCLFYDDNYSWMNHSGPCTLSRKALETNTPGIRHNKNSGFHCCNYHPLFAFSDVKCSFFVHFARERIVYYLECESWIAAIRPLRKQCKHAKSLFLCTICRCLIPDGARMLCARSVQVLS